MTTPSAAFERNDRYLREFVEQYDLCPFARRCRESGALERRVLEQRTLEVEPVALHVEELSGEAWKHVEVGLLIFSQLKAGFSEFERFATRLRERVPRSEFFIVPFHPDSPAVSENESRLVSLLRRSPDPTLQLVRASLLDRVRGGIDPEDTIFVDPATVDLDSPLPVRPAVKSLSSRIAEANFETVRQVGTDRLVALLASMKRSD